MRSVFAAALAVLTLGVKAQPESALLIEIAQLAVVGDLNAGPQLPTRLHEVTRAAHALSIPPSPWLTNGIQWTIGADTTNVARP